ncbi:MAG: hypothetical protein KDA80_06635 [Planctomycetaceae bacterium]|nr:hypothetical protein [Planctomycetaceae bacterium]
MTRIRNSLRLLLSLCRGRWSLCAATVGAMALAVTPVHGDVPPVFSKSRQFRIPFQFDQQELSQLGAEEIRLFVSTDHGETWALAESVPPAKARFSFQAPNDGEYWFSVKSLVSNNLEYPAGPHAPGLKVHVDSIPPEMVLDLSEESPETLSLSWSLRDEHLDLSSLKLEYQEPGDETWYPVAIEATPSGRTSWTFSGEGTVRVRGAIADLAGHQRTTERKLEIERTAISKSLSAATPSSVLTPETLLGESSEMASETGTHSRAVVAENSASVISPPAQGPSMAESRRFENALPLIMPIQMTREQSRDFKEATPRIRRESTHTATDRPQEIGDLGNLALPIEDRAPEREGILQPPPMSVPESHKEPSASRAPRVARLDLAAPGPSFVETTSANEVEPLFGEAPELSQAPSSTSTQPTLPPRPIEPPDLQQDNVLPTALAIENRAHRRDDHYLVNSRAFRVGYQVDGVGPSGVGSVQLYITEDNGQHWFHYGTDSDRQSPMQVTVPKDGTYGFSFRIVNGLGLVTPPPQPGDSPDVTVSVDRVPPVVRLLPIRQGQGREHNQVVVEWTAQDREFDDRPVSLYYAAQPTGPWEAITGWQANTGRHTFTLPSDINQKLYIRLDVRDAAGNVTRADGATPLFVDHSKPTARIIEVESLKIGQ